MNLADYPKPILDAYSAFEALRRIGFSSDNIFFMIAKDGHDRAKRWAVFVVLKQRSKEFSVTIGGHSKTMKPMKKYFKLWQTFARTMNELPGDVNGRVYGDDMPVELREHYFGWLNENGGAMGLTAALIAKGIALPKREAN